MNQKPNVIADFFIHNKLTQNQKLTKTIISVNHHVIL